MHFNGYTCSVNGGSDILQPGENLIANASRPYSLLYPVYILAGHTSIRLYVCLHRQQGTNARTCLGPRTSAWSQQWSYLAVFIVEY